jgi:hypothetical protein
MSWIDRAMTFVKVFAAVFSRVVLMIRCVEKLRSTL